MSAERTVAESSPWTGTDLRLWRKSLNMSQKQAAFSLGVATRGYLAWETSKQPVPRLVELACRFLEERPWELILD